jgi:glutamine synthetase
MTIKEQIANLNKIIKQNNVEIIDLKCVDLIGRLHHISLPLSEITLNDIYVHWN